MSATEKLAAMLLCMLLYLIYRGTADSGDDWLSKSDIPQPGAGSGEDLLDAWAEAIKSYEGWFPGSRSFRNNNPGNLKAGAGAVGKDAEGFAVFPDFATGWAALKADLRAKITKYPDFSILQIMTRYLGGNPQQPQLSGEGDPFAYARAVANRLGVSINARLRDVFA